MLPPKQAIAQALDPSQILAAQAGSPDTRQRDFLLSAPNHAELNKLLVGGVPAHEELESDQFHLNLVMISVIDEGH